MTAWEKSCKRLPAPPTAWINQIHAAGGARGSTNMVMVFVCCLCFLCRLVWLLSLVVCRQVRERCKQV
jgi:hypothetical protein